MKTWRIAGINFDHMHMGDHLRLIHETPNAEIVALCDEDRARMATAQTNFGVAGTALYDDLDRCIDEARPDLVVLCPATARHADYVERVARHKVGMLIEKPFAPSLRDADRMIAAAKGLPFFVNWPLAWYPPYLTTKRVIDDGTIGEVIEVHHYGGNRGPLYHLADKVEVSEAEVIARKASSWWYKKESAGGSMLDYMGYGVTLGTWFMDGRAPTEVTTVVDTGRGLEVDEHSITVARYGSGLSKFETRWGTFTDPWTLQPQPKCGFVIVGTKGTIAAYDYDDHISLQTHERQDIHPIPVDQPAAPRRNPIEYLIHIAETGETPFGPLDPAIARIGQQIVDSAQLSVAERRTVKLVT